MNAKNRLIEKLLEAAKKHKILTYPVLAMVAVISVFNYFFSWSTGAGKRIVAVVMVLVMLVSQSYFLTSSATALVDTEETVQQQQELQAQNGDELIADGNSAEDVTGEELVEAEKDTEDTEEGTTTVTTDATVGDTSESTTEELDTTSETTSENTSETTLENASENVTTGVADSSEDTGTQETSTEVITDNTVNAEDSVYTDDTTAPAVPDNTETIPADTDTVVKAEESELYVQFSILSEDKTSFADLNKWYIVKNENSDTYRFVTGDWESSADTALKAHPENDGLYLTYEGWYDSTACTNKIDPNNLSGLNEHGYIRVYAEGKVQNYQVTISPGVDDVATDNVSYAVDGDLDEHATPTSGVYAVPATEAEGSYTGSFVIKDAVRMGYKLVGAVGDGVSATLNEDGSLTVSLSGNQYKKNVKLVWEAEVYKIAYESASGSVVQEVTYNGTKSSDLIDFGIETVQKEGYVYAGWELDGVQLSKDEDAGKFVSNSGIQAAAYQYWKANGGDPAVLKPYYTYAGIELDTNEITYEYRSEQGEPEIIRARYKNTNANSKTFSYTLGTVTNEKKESVVLSDYGINIEVGGTEIQFVTVSIAEGGLKRVGTLNIPITVKDSNIEEDKEQPEPLMLKIRVTPYQLTLDASGIGEFEKTYDGTTNCSFANKEIPTNLSGVTVNVVSSKYAGSKAGECNVLLTLPESGWLNSNLENDSPDNYVLTNKKDEFGNIIVGGGFIKQRLVNVKTYAEMNGKDYIRAGEANPKFVAEEIPTDKPDEGLIGDDKDRLNELITLVPEPERDDSRMKTSKDEVYRIVPTDIEDSNYSFNFNYSNVGTFKVRLEAADGLFEAIGKHEDTGWYGADSKIIPKADSGYDSIRVEGSDKAESQIILTEENTKGKKITFQLYNSETKAYTAFTTFPVDVDLTKPTYVKCEVIEDGVDAGNGLFFPSEGGTVSLGHYFNKSITFRVTYKDTASNPRKLVYSLTGNLTDATDSAGQEIGYSNLTEGEAVFTFTIPVENLMDKKGGIQFYAVDGAGNASDLMDLVSKGDEWIVEKTAPEIDMLIKAGGTSATDGITITGNDLETYYGQVKAYLSAEDGTSPITSITWIVNEEEYVQKLEDEKMRVNETLSINANTFTPKEGGWFTVSAYVTDKAGNQSLESTPVSFKVDDVMPEVTIDGGYDIPKQEVTLTFNAYDTLSGIRYINVKDAETGEMIQHVVQEVKLNEAGYMTSYCHITTTEQGVYIIEVADKAGNVYTSDRIELDMVSNEVPECPTVTFSPEIGENGWITAEEVKACITNVRITNEDKMPVDTMYQLWKDGETSMHVTTIDSDNDVEEISLSSGIYQLKVWSESLTGVPCALPDEGEHIYDIKVDSIVPLIEYELKKGADNSLVVNFSVKDEISGVNGEKIQVLNGSYPVTAQITALEDGSGYTGSFNITEVGNYTIVAEDIAGNYVEAPAFRPMSMKVNAVKNISATAATVGAYVMKGTYNIKSASISYRKFNDANYTETEALPVMDEATGNMSVSAVIGNLENGTNYVYKVTAISEGEEVLEYVGYFKTLANGETGITISGTTRYADGREAAITVGLFAGNSCIRAVEVDTSVGNTFTFSNVPDGNYSVVATDGVYTKTARVLIREGRIIYPDTGALDLVLSGKNTSVVITTEDTPNVTADNLDSLFNDEINYTDEDKILVEDGLGTVEFKLYATLMKVSAVSAGEISAMYSASSDKNKIVGAYLDLSLYKIVTDEDGNVNRSQVHKLSGGANVSVTIPLGDLAGKSGLEVIRIHKDGDTFTGAYLVDQDNNPATYTITTSQFSTYAVLYNPDPEPEPEPEPVTTEEIKDGTIDPSNNGTINSTTEGIGLEPGEDDPTTEEKNDDSDDGKEDDKKPASSGGSSVGSLRSSGSAKTGDATPIAMLIVLMSVSLGGFVILRKKSND